MYAIRSYYAYKGNVEPVFYAGETNTAQGVVVGAVVLVEREQGLLASLLSEGYGELEPRVLAVAYADVLIVIYFLGEYGAGNVRVVP